MIYLNLLNKIFGPKKPLSRQEIDDIKLDRASFETQQKAEDDEFNSEAMEGWNSIDPDVNTAMRNVDSKIKNSLNQSAKNNDSRNVYLFFGGFTIVMLMLIMYTYQGNQVNKELEDHKGVNQQIVEAESTEIKESTANKEQFNKKIAAIDSYSPIEKSEQITKDQLKGEIETSKKVSEQKTVEKKGQAESTEIDKLSPKSLEEVPTNSTPDLSYSNASEVYLNSLKTVDYRSMREDKPIKLLQELPMGTPANRSEREGEYNSEIEQTTKEINYIDYLDETQRLFAKESFKRALRRYLIILDHYPKDVNAHFYSGLCYHNLGEYEKAVAHFEESYNLQIGNFKEEAEWFKAKALLRTNNRDNGLQMLKKIEKGGGFYSEQAKKLLNSL